MSNRIIPAAFEKEPDAQPRALMDPASALTSHPPPENEHSHRLHARRRPAGGAGSAATTDESTLHRKFSYAVAPFKATAKPKLVIARPTAVMATGKMECAGLAIAKPDANPTPNTENVNPAS